MAEEGVLASLVVKLVADTAGLVVGLGRATDASEKTAHAVEKGFANVNKTFEKSKEHLIELAALIGIGFGVEYFKEFIVGGFEATDQMQKLASKIGVTNDTIYGMKVLAADTGVSFETLSMSFQKMGIQLENNSKLAPELQKGFRDLGLDAKELKELKPEEAFGKIADAMAGVTNQAERNKISMEIFGRSGIELNNILKAGSAGLEEASKKAKELGITLDEVDSEKVVKAVDQMELLKASIKAAGQHIAVELAPFVDAAAKSLLSMVKAAGGFGPIIANAMNTGINVLAWFADAWRRIQIVIDVVKIGFLGFSEYFNWSVLQWVKIAVWFGQVFSNLFTAIVAEGKTMGAGFELIWAGIKKIGAGTLSFIASAFADMISGMAEQGRRVLGNDVADAMEVGAGKLRTTFAGIKGQADLAFRGVEGAAGIAAEKSKAAWAGVFDTNVAENPAVVAMQERVDLVDEKLQETKRDLDALMAAPPAGEGLKQWVEQVKAAQSEVAELEKKAKGGTSTDEPTGNEGAEAAYADKLKARLEGYKQYYTQAEADEGAYYQQQQNEAQEAFDKMGTSEQQKNLILQGLKQDHEKRLNDIESRAITDRRGMFTKEFQDRVGAFGSMFGNLASLSNSGNRKLFEIGKAARYAETITNTAAAAMASFNVGAGIGGPALGAVFAGAAIAAGAVQLATINSANMGGGGSVSTPSVSVPSSASAGAASPGVTQAASSGPTINLTLGSDDDLVSTAAVRKLLTQVKGVLRDGFNLQDS